MRSCSSWMIFVEEPAEQVAPMHPAWPAAANDHQIGGWIRRFQSARPMRPMGVVVGGIDPQDLLEVAAANHQQPVQALGPDRTDPALRVGVRVGGLHRRDEHLATLRPEHVIEPAAELRVPIADEEAHPPSLFSQHQQQVSGLLGDPGAIRVGGHPGQVDPPGVQLDEEQYVQPSQPDRIHGEKSQATIPAAC